MKKPILVSLILLNEPLKALMLVASKFYSNNSEKVKNPQIPPCINVSQSLTTFMLYDIGEFKAKPNMLRNL